MIRNPLKVKVGQKVCWIPQANMKLTHIGKIWKIDDYKNGRLFFVEWDDGEKTKHSEWEHQLFLYPAQLSMRAIDNTGHMNKEDTNVFLGFLEFLFESRSFVGVVKNSWDKTSAEVFKNPGRHELKDVSDKYNQSRIIISPDNKDVHVWKSSEAMHHNVEDALGVSGDKGYVCHKRKKFWMYNPKPEHENHPWIKRMGLTMSHGAHIDAHEDPEEALVKAMGKV